MFWPRLMIVLGVLLLSAYLGRQPTENYLILTIGVGAILILLRWPRLGLIALLVGSLVVPFSIGTGTQTPLNIAVLLIPVLLAVWFADMIRRHEFQLTPSRTTLPLLAFATAATVSLIASGLPWNLFAGTAPLLTQLGGWTVFVFSVGVFLLVANQVTNERWLKMLVALFLSIGGLYISGRINPLLSPLSEIMNQLGSDGGMFWAWVVALACGQLLFNRKLRRLLQVGLAVLSSCYARSGLVPRSLLDFGILASDGGYRNDSLVTVLANGIVGYGGSCPILACRKFQSAKHVGGIQVVQRCHARRGERHFHCSKYFP